MFDRGGLREFVAVVEKGSFTAAADILDVSTSFVSREIKRLEERLHTRLLHRSTRSITLTDSGRHYYERAREIHDRIEALESEMADLQELPKGLIRVTAAGLFADRYVAPALAEFVTKYPEVSIDLDSRMEEVDIIEEGYDLAIRLHGTLPDTSLIARKVAPRRVMVCGSPSYLVRSGRPDSPDDLYSHNCLKLYKMPWRFAYPEEVRVVKVQGNWVCNNGRALVNAAVRGIGLIRLSEYYMEDELRRGELEVVLEEYEVPDVYTWIVYPERKQMPTRVRFLIDFLSERLKRDSVYKKEKK
ncbi:MAG: LysR substrate-binding domain-containing protein [Proteobacteria bacterium]|nr:LysR substrate-binding domain-containing protein [Pseudomonadota bacterium]